MLGQINVLALFLGRLQVVSDYVVSVVNRLVLSRRWLFLCLLALQCSVNSTAKGCVQASSANLLLLLPCFEQVFHASTLII